MTMYQGANAAVRTAYCNTESLEVTVGSGRHHGSELRQAVDVCTCH